MKIPSEITAGDSLTWEDDPTTDNLGNTIDSTWTLKYAFQQSGVANISVTSTANGSGWTTTIPKASSATWAQTAKVFWQAYAESGTSRVTLGSGSLKVNPNVSTATTSTELRSQTQQDLDAVELAIRTMVSGGAVAEYTIHGRTLRKIPLAELRILRNELKAQLIREKKAQNIANGLGNPSNIYIRFKK